MDRELQIRSDDREVTLLLVRVDEPGAGDDPVVDVELSGPDVSGRVMGVTYQPSAVSAFQSALDTLERTRSGTAATCNLGVADATNEFELDLRAKPTAPIAARVHLLRVRYDSGGRFAPSELFCSFGMEQEDLPALVSGWRRLFG